MRRSGRHARAVPAHPHVGRAVAGRRAGMSFDEALHAVAGVEGWMTDAQARRLWDRARTLEPGGTVVEIGSYRGRSAIVLARAAREGVEVVAIDPHAGNDRGPQQIHGTADEGEADHCSFLANLERAGCAGVFVFAWTDEWHRGGYDIADW